MHVFPVTFEQGEFDQEHLDVEQLEAMASEKVIQTFKDKLQRENAKVPVPLMAGQEPPKPAQNAVRNLMIRKLDQLWQEHLLRMDHLRSDVTLRAVGQRDPLTEFKHEAFAMFDELSRNLRTEIARSIFRFEIIAPQQTLQQLLMNAGLRMETNRSLFNDLQQPQLPSSEGQSQEEGKDPDDEEPNEPLSAAPRVGRNELCPCGSGKKFKKCCATEA